MQATSMNMLQCNKPNRGILASATVGCFVLQVAACASYRRFAGCARVRMHIHTFTLANTFWSSD
eukprot:scaffold33462_cov19-Tisochrysis_lutea.AAC.1